MRTDVMSISSVRLFRLAPGTLLLLVGCALLVAQGLAWLDLEPRMMCALEGGLCTLGTALGAVPVLVVRSMPVALADTLLGFGARAMLLVVTQEINPESRSNGHHRLASLGLCVGFCLMMVMDTALS